MMHLVKKGTKIGKMHILDFLNMLVARLAATIELEQLVKILRIGELVSHIGLRPIVLMQKENMKHV
jgi:hypothetical protein